MRSHFRSLLFLSVVWAGLCVAAMPARATPVFQIESGALTVTALLSNGVPTFDIRGAVLLGVSDLGLPLSQLSLSDSTGGTDPSGAALPFGNAFIIGTDANSAVSKIGDILFFDFANGKIPDSATLLLPAIISVTPTGSTPDTVLATLTGNSPVLFRFGISSFVDLGNGGQIAQWQLQQVGVPEPVSSLLLGSGCLAMLGAFRFLRLGRGGRCGTDRTRQQL